MELEGKRIGFVLTASFCTVDKVLPQIKILRQMGAEIMPIISEKLDITDTRYNTSEQFKTKLSEYAGEKHLTTITEVEPIGPEGLLDLVIVAPCTGNTIAKLAMSITDSPSLMAVKAHLRNSRPVVLAIATNDGLSGNAKNIGLLLNSKNVYFVPFGQDGPFTKQNSLQSKFSLIPKAAQAALLGKQIQPVLLGAGECLED